MNNEALQPRGMRAPMASAYCGMGRSKFLALVAKGIAPKPKKPSVGVAIWDKRDLDEWLDSLEGRK